MRILIAEDDAAIASALSETLVDGGHVVNHVFDGNSADAALRSEPYDAVVLDLGLPRMDGIEVVRRARSRGNDVSILIVTARDGVGDRVKVLDEGADDYLVKPFALIEFAARVRALLRRRSNNGCIELAIGKLRVDLDGRRAWMEDRPLDLTARESALLELLVTRVDRLVTRIQLTDALCNWEQDISDNGLDIAVHRLRRKLEGSGTRIKTIRGLGYVFQESAVECLNA